MAHYFDDIFHRHDGGMQTPKSPRSPRLRRASATRSIAARSDFSTNDLNGYDDETDGGFPGRSGSVFAQAPADEAARARERAEADDHLHAYIAQQLERVRLEQSANGYGGGDEFEAQP